MNIVDDYSSFPWSVPLKTKDQAYPALKAWQLTRENETGLKVGTYRTDNGELKSSEMNDWLKTRGTNHQFSAPHTSAHIGRVERMHRTLMAKARTMRIYAQLPPFLWDELYLTASHLQAKTTTRSLLDKTPFELWYNKKPDYSYMREIGCRAFVLIQNKHNPKIYERSIECVLIGYETNSKSYRCYHRESRKVVSSYHVQFLESHHGHLPKSPITKETVDLTSSNDHCSTPHEATPSISETPPCIPAPPEEDLPFPLVTQPLQHTSEQQPADDNHHDNQDNPETPDVPQNQTRRSNRNPPKESRMDQTMREIREGADRVTQARKEGRPTTWDYANVAELFGPDTEATVKAVEALKSLEKSPDSCFMGLDDIGDNTPKAWEEAKNSPDAAKWKAAYQEELQSLKDMNVYKLVPRSAVPEGQRIHKGKPVFRVKSDENGNAVRWKVRHVFKGFEQIYGRDYTKTTSPTARMESWRLVLHIAASLNWDIQQIDVKTAFLYGLLPEDEIQYMEQPGGFEEPKKEDWVWRLERSLYGMKQAGRVWNGTLNEEMVSWGFTRLSAESCIYYRKRPTGTIITVVHVDDYLSAASSKEENETFKEQMRTRWTISDLGEAKFCLGIAISRDRTNHTIHLSQTAFIDKLTAQFGQTDAKPTSVPMDPGLKLSRPDLSQLSNEERAHIAKLPYRSLVGGLLYLAIGTRADITYAVQQLSQFLDCYTTIHWDAAIRVLRYLKATRTLKLTLGGKNNIQLIGYSDSDWANCPNTRRSIGGYAFSLGSGATSWSARKQKTVAASTCEAEYIAAFEATKEALWVRQLLHEIGFTPPSATSVMCDNNAARIISEDPLLHARVKHMDIKYHFLRENTQSGKVTLQYVPTKDNIADIFTKPLEKKQFTRLRKFLGLSEISQQMSSR